MRTALPALLAACAAAAAQGPVERDAAWEAVFARPSGWNGGDIAHAIALPGGRTLWLFGDSIIGPVEDGARVGGSVMVRSAIAWHATPDAGALPEHIEFAIPDAGHDVAVADWTRPTPGLWPEGAWYWLMGDGAAVVGADGERGFVLFATAIGPSGNPEGMWNFRRIGGAIIVIENPADAPDRWRAEQRVNPIVDESARFGEPARPGENWGLAIVAWPPDADAGTRTLHVYGVRADAPGDNSLLVARCTEADLAAPSRWRFFDGRSWSADRADATPIATGLVDEFTIQPLRRQGRDELILIQSEPMLGQHVLARAAASPEGPWSEPARVYEVPEPGADERLLTYAAKGHAHLSREGELLVSYAINSTDFGQIFRDSSLYRPRFVRVPTAALPAAP